MENRAYKRIVVSKYKSMYELSASEENPHMSHLLLFA